MFCLKLSEIHFKISRDLKERISETAEMQKKLEKQLPALDKVNKGRISEWHLLLYYNAPQDSGDLVWHFCFVGIFQKRRFWRQIAWWTSWIEQEAQSRQSWFFKHVSLSTLIFLWIFGIRNVLQPRSECLWACLPGAPATCWSSSGWETEKTWRCRFCR